MKLHATKYRSSGIDWMETILDWILGILVAGVFALLGWTIFLLCTGGFDTPGCPAGLTSVVTGHQEVLVGKMLVNEPLYACGKVVHVHGFGTPRQH